MEHAFDFFKPNLSFPFPAVDGHYSNVCYLKALDSCYQLFCSKVFKQTKEEFSVDKADFVVFHSPYDKL
jgi:hydroxymethylglutaryl-CoA synthase